MIRWILVTLLICLGADEAGARFPPRGAGAPSANTMTVAVSQTSVELTQSAQVGFTWHGSAPSSFTSASWSGGSCPGAGAATITGTFVRSDPLVLTRVAAPASTGTCNLTVTANNGASATVTGIVINGGANDSGTFAVGAYGPTTLYLYPFESPYGQGTDNAVIATYFARGFVGPPVISISNTAGHSGTCVDAATGLTGDAYCFTTQLRYGQTEPGLVTAMGIALNALGSAAQQAGQTAFYIDVTLTDTGNNTQYPLHVVVNALTGPSAGIITANSVANSTLPIGNAEAQLPTGQLVLDSQVSLAPTFLGGFIPVGTVYTESGENLTFNDPSGKFTYGSGGSQPSGQSIGITATTLSTAAFGPYPVTIQAVGGPMQHYTLYIGHDYQPVVAYRPTGTLYDSMPKTNGFGSWPVAHWDAYTDTHSGNSNSNMQQRTIMSDDSGALSLWNTGGVYLTGSISGKTTINASFKASGMSAKTTTMTLALPVTAGTILSGHLTGSITPSLTNFVPYANIYRTNHRPSDQPKTVIALTASGFTADWTKASIDLLNDGGTQVDNAQLIGFENPTSFVLNDFTGAHAYINDGGWARNTPQNPQGGIGLTRYFFTGVSGNTANVVATNLSALDHLTPKVDKVVITATDGAGTFDTEEFDLTINWCSSAEITVGPSNSNYPSPTFANPYAMQQAMWTDYINNGASATMACNNVRLLRGVTAAAARDTTGWDYGPEGGGSHFSGGVWPYPVRLFGDDSTQATFTGDISNGSGGAGTILHLDSAVTGPGLFAGDMIKTGVVTATASCTASGTTLTCTGASATPVYWNWISGTGITPLTNYVTGCTFVAGSGTCTLRTALTIGSSETVSFSPGVILTSNIDATHWNVHIGPSATSATALITSTAMTTKMPRVELNFYGFQTAGGSAQGCLMMSGGFDKEFDNIELHDCSGAYTSFGFGAFIPGDTGGGAAFWDFDSDHGNVRFDNDYIYNSDDGILNSGYGGHYKITNTMFSKNGNAAGDKHNIYISTSASFIVDNIVSNDVWRVHDIKTRAMYNRFTNSVFADGINGLGSVPVEVTVGGDTVVGPGNIILKTANSRDEFNPITVQITPEISNAGGTLPLTWPINNIVVQGNKLLTVTPQSNSWQQPPEVITTWGWPVAFGAGTLIDLIRNVPIASTSTSNQFFGVTNSGVQYTTPWWFSSNSGGLMIDGGGNTTLTTYPFQATEFVDVATGTPPLRMPPVGAFSQNQGPPTYNGSVASAPGAYGITMVIPDGSPDGTQVTNGHLSADGTDWNGLTSTSYSFINISTTNDNAHFKFVSDGSGGFFLEANGTLHASDCAVTPGICHIEIQGTGNGYNYGNAQPFSPTNVLAVIVGSYN